jgi:hypothetical protein
VQRRSIGCGTFIMERSPRIRLELGLISFCLSKRGRPNARSHRNKRSLSSQFHAAGKLRAVAVRRQAVLVDR